jgi:hypothetical protein
VLDFAQVSRGRETFALGLTPSWPIAAFGTSSSTGLARANQQFLLFLQDDSAYVSATRDSGSVSDIAKVSRAEETPAIDFPCNGGANQSFLLEPNDDGAHAIRAKHSRLVLDVDRESRDDRTLVLLCQIDRPISVAHRADHLFVLVLHEHFR